MRLLSLQLFSGATRYGRNTNRRFLGRAIGNFRDLLLPGLFMLCTIVNGPGLRILGLLR